MKTKLKIGDRVRIVGELSKNAAPFLNRVGTVVDDESQGLVAIKVDHALSFWPIEETHWSVSSLTLIPRNGLDIMLKVAFGD